MSRGTGRRIATSAVVAGVMGVAVAAVVAGAALAASSPLHAGKVYATGGGIGSRFTLALITSATSSSTLIAGPANPPLGSQYALSTGSVRCPHAPRNSGLAKGNSPFALFGFPGARLKVRHGALGFSVTRTVAKQSVLGSTAKPFKFTVRIAGTVKSASKITGTMTASGGPCAVTHPISWTAVYSPQDKVAPGA